MNNPTSHNLAAAPVCRKCGIELTEENWYPSHMARDSHICKYCHKKQVKAWRHKQGFRKQTKSTKKPVTYMDNHSCPLYLGVHITERVLSHVFKDVERMPINNPGYDFICNKGKKIDAKSSCQKKNGSWQFTINRNTMADFFLCIAFDNREDLTPLHAWLIPGGVVNSSAAITITSKTLHEWDEYSLDTTKISECCDSIRTAGDNPPQKPSNLPPHSSRYSIISYMAAGLRPVKIAAKMGIAMSTLQYHLTAMAKQGLIRKVGYGTWEVIEEPTTEKHTPRGLNHVGSVNTPQPRGLPREVTQSDLTRFTQDAVRTHAITTTWQAPRDLRNWNNEKRTQYLDSHNIPHIQLGIAGGGQRIIVKDRKVWLLNKVLIIYDKASYFAQTALEGKNTALATHLSIIKHIERLLHTDFQIGSDYKFRVSRQHYALIYNALASQYNETGEKLEIRTGKGVWFLIDNSYNMNEAETVHPTTAMTDNRKVQNFFNGLKDIPAQQGAPTYTPGFVLEVMNGIQANQMMFAQNIESHITAIKDLGAGVRDMNALLKELAERR